MQSKLYQAQNRKMRMTKCLTLVREILENATPEESLFFSSALEDEVSAFGFGGTGVDVEELNAKITRLTADRDRLLFKLGEVQIAAEVDAERRIAEIEASNQGLEEWW